MWLDLGLASAYKLFYTVGDGYCRLCRFVQLSVITAHWKWTFSAHCLPSSICFCLFMLRPLHSSTDDSISPVTQWVYIHEVIPNHWTHLSLIGCWATVSWVRTINLVQGSSCREDEVQLWVVCTPWFPSLLVVAWWPGAVTRDHGDRSLVWALHPGTIAGH